MSMSVFSVFFEHFLVFLLQDRRGARASQHQVLSDSES